MPINHIVEVNFGGFRRAVDRLKCVYIDVDHRYYHSNVGLPASAQYSEIDIKPGYQKLCGTQALAYVRYRHTDSDFVRSARQQDFLRQAKGQFSLSSILGDRTELVKIFARYTRTDVRSNDAILRLLKLAFLSSKNPIREVKFPAYDVPGGTYLGITPQNLQAVVDGFQNAKATAWGAPDVRRDEPDAQAPHAPPDAVAGPPARRDRRSVRGREPGDPGGDEAPAARLLPGGAPGQRRLLVRRERLPGDTRLLASATARTTATTPTGSCCRPGSRASTTGSRE